MGVSFKTGCFFGRNDPSVHQAINMGQFHDLTTNLRKSMRVEGRGILEKLKVTSGWWTLLIYTDQFVFRVSLKTRNQQETCWRASSFWDAFAGWYFGVGFYGPNNFETHPDILMPTHIPQKLCLTQRAGTENLFLLDAPTGSQGSDKCPKSFLCVLGDADISGLFNSTYLHFFAKKLSIS